MGTTDLVQLPLFTDRNTRGQERLSDVPKVVQLIHSTAWAGAGGEGGWHLSMSIPAKKPQSVRQAKGHGQGSLQEKLPLPQASVAQSPWQPLLPVASSASPLWGLIYISI